jgi:hypothetical protein
MLRTLLWVLGIANVLLLVAQLGAFEGLAGGLGQTAQREPERLQRQVHPEWVQVLPAPAASAALAAADAAASAARASHCLQAGPFSNGEAEAAERTLRDAGIPPAAWQAIRSEVPGVYMVYMGRYSDRELLQRKRDEVRRMHLEVEELRSPAELAPGLNLGRFDGKPAADAALARMVQRGVRTARVIMLRAAQNQTLVRLPAADGALRARLAALRLPSGPGFAACDGEALPPLPVATAIPALPAASKASAAPAASAVPAASAALAASARASR